MCATTHRFFALSVLCHALWMLLFTAGVHALELSPGQTVKGTVGGGQTNVYTFSAEAGEAVKALAVRTGGSASSVVGLRIVAPDGGLLGADSRSEDAVAYLEAVRVVRSGVYQVRVWNAFSTQFFDYELGLIKSTGQNQVDSDGSGGVIAPGETKTGRIESPADMDAYTFTASANDTIKVLAVKTALSSGSVVGLQVMAPDGSVLGVDARSEDAVAYFDSLKLPQSGTYQLVVWNVPFPGSLLVNQTFDYAVTFTQSSGSNQVDSDGSGGPILPGETKSGRIESPTDMDAYPFAASAGDTIKVLAVMSTPSSSAVVGLQVVAPDGSVLGVDARGEDAVAYFDALKLPQSGSYQLLIWNIPFPGALFVNQTYDYVLSLLKIPGPNVGDPEGGLIGPEETKTGTISLGDLDAFEFDGLPCQNVDLRVSPRTSGAGPVTLELRAPDGSILSSAAGSARATSRFYGLPTVGKYHVTIRSTDGRKAFDYDLSLQLSPLPPKPQIGAGRPQLFITSCTNETVLLWPASAVGFSVESTLQLNPPTLWLDVAGTPAVIGEWSVFSHPKLSAQEYFRLREKP